MGGGTRRRPDAPKAPVSDIRRTVREGIGAGGPWVDLHRDQCEETRRVTFAVVEGLSPTDGAAVRVVGPELTVVCEGVAQGRVVGNEASALRRCLERGFALEGQIVSVSFDRGEAVAHVSGVPPEG